jgi:pimeloyl-ACP methyl ester carboxylesterase
VPTPRRKLLSALAGATLAVAGLSLPAVPAPLSTAEPAYAHGRDAYRPVIFVHGGAGSAAQFQTQSKRLASNGYPAELIEAQEYDSLNVATILPQVFTELDARITRLLAASRADRVDMLGHSLGTFVMQAYLTSSPERAARVAHYVNLDGRTATALPGGVPTLAIWGEGSPERTIVGATNVHFPDQSHTQTVSSVESFVEIFKFFRGRAPHTTRIVPQPAGQVKISGRAVLFPSNFGVTDATLEVYEVGTLTGWRLHHRPVYTATLTGDGSFGPFRARPGARYEFAIVRPGAAVHHLYFAPFKRTDTFVRLLTSRPGEGLGALVDVSDRHTSLVINRQKEWWGDQGSGSDVLLINGQNILNAANAPRTKRVIGMFAFDNNSDGVTDLSAPLPEFFSQTFISGADVFIPAAPRHFGLVTVVMKQRGGGDIDLLNVPAWPSSDHRITLNLNDYLT